MTRRRLSLQYITSDSARKSTFNKRKSGIMKKAEELSTLCGVEMCAIIFSPYEPEPDVWPSQLGAQRVIARFRNMTKTEQSKKMVNLESFSREQLTKTEEQLMKQQRENRHKDMNKLMYQCLTGRGFEDLSIVNLNEMGGLLSQNIRDIDRRIDFLTTSHGNGERNG